MRIQKRLVYYFIHWDSHIPKWVQRLVAFVPIIAVAYALYYLFQTAHFIIFFENISIDIVSLALILGSILLMIANWYLEAVKWRRFVTQTIPIRTKEALQAVLYGTSLGIVTPNRIGDYSGRAMILPRAHRKQGVSATIYSSICQNIPTFAIGCAACTVLYKQDALPELNVLLLLCCMAGIIGTVVFGTVLFAPAGMEQLMSRIGISAGQRYFATLSERYPRHLLLSNVILSFTRYGIFIIQFWLIANAFVPVGFTHAFIALAATYLVNTVVPSNQLVEFGVRIGVPSYLLSYYGIAAEPIAVSAFILWVINLGIPAIVGGFFAPRGSKE